MSQSTSRNQSLTDPDLRHLISFAPFLMIDLNSSPHRSKPCHRVNIEREVLAVAVDWAPQPRVRIRMVRKQRLHESEAPSQQGGVQGGVAGGVGVRVDSLVEQDGGFPFP
jgi:hypothetical protein